MAKDKPAAKRSQLSASILAAMLLGAFLGSPVPGFWADHLLHKPAPQALLTESAVHSKIVSPAVSAASSSQTPAVSAASSSQAPAVKSPGPDVDVQPDYASLNASRGGTASRKEKDVLIRLINAEAYGLSYKAKLAVGQVVVNRWAGPYYGDDLMAIMTAPHQFTPIYNGSAYEKEIEPDSVKAATAVLSGVGVKGLTEDTYYFVNPAFTKDKTIENKMEFVCEIDGLHFYRSTRR